ncbi:MAG: hypothetical protein QNJ53_11720 [Pleurocapsa sp. MO_192.B19]|nr:hypothetical protein [Pleurocapsa sp. MO_192.B19]
MAPQEAVWHGSSCHNKRSPTDAVDPQSHRLIAAESQLFDDDTVAHPCPSTAHHNADKSLVHGNELRYMTLSDRAAELCGMNQNCWSFSWAFSSSEPLTYVSSTKKLEKRKAEM